jgi:hypothetical protein
MPDQEIVIRDDAGTEHVFPAGFDPQRAIAIVRAQTAGKPSDSGGLATFAASKLTPMAGPAVDAFAQSSTVPKTMGALARGGTTIGGVAHGIYKGNPSEVLAAPMEGWAAGKGGYFLGQGAQALAKPVAGLLQRLAPYLQGLSKVGSTRGAAQGVGDLAQMADPKRRDIGFLGIGATQPGQEPPPLNVLLSKLLRR